MSKLSERPVSTTVVIGLTTYAESARWLDNDAPALVLHETYARMVAAAGAVPVLLPPLYSVGSDAAGVLERLDGLVITGGPDLDPAQYGQDPHARTSPPRMERDAAERALLATAVDTGLPVLCICRGMQLLNVWRGGTLIQHLPDVVGHRDHAPAPGVFGRHPVVVDEGSRLAATLGQTQVDVATLHHQGIGELGKGLSAVARAQDGTIEAIEDNSQAFLVGVQWHPEAGNDLELMIGLVEAARVRRDAP